MARTEANMAAPWRLMRDRSTPATRPPSNSRSAGALVELGAVPDLFDPGQPGVGAPPR